MMGSFLLPQDLALLARCGISQETAESAGLRRVSSAEGAELVGPHGSSDLSGIAFPYFWPGQGQPREYRLRRDQPEIEFKDGQERPKNKYLAPPGRANLIYFPPHAQIEWLHDTSIPIVIAEGEKKTLALWGLAWFGLSESIAIPRFLPIGLSGVWNWRGTIGKTPDPSGKSTSVKGVITDFEQIGWHGRKVTILFDVNIRNNDSVQAALSKLSDELRRRGSTLWRFEWPAVPADVNGIDDLIGSWGYDRTLTLLSNNVHPVMPTLADQRNSTRQFSTSEGHHHFDFPKIGIGIDVDRLRRERHELVGELAVRSTLPGSKTVNGYLSIGDFNFSSVRARSDRAKVLSERGNAKDLDWLGLLEEVCQKVLQQERAGTPAVDLRTLPKAEINDYCIDGFVFPKRHPSILFGDGGTGKSYVALYLAGNMAMTGLNVALFDWELSGEDHRDRLERLFGSRMPIIQYARCDRPLTSEVDRLARMVRDLKIDFAFYDSIAFACDGRPEDAEVAGRYFRCIRQIQCGSLHIAHVNKSEDSDKKPFGSAFWHNGARSTWFVQSSEENESGSLSLGFFNRKVNCGPLNQPMSFLLKFDKGSTIFCRQALMDTPEFVSKLSVRKRMLLALQKRPLTSEELAIEIDAEVETIKRTIRRGRSHFIVLDGGKIGLVDRNTEEDSKGGQFARTV